MPTILMVKGWRVFFYSNEGTEPMHVHARKGDSECKFWIHEATFEIDESFERGLTPQLRREIRQINLPALRRDLCRVEFPRKKLVQTAEKPILARSIQTTPHALLIELDEKTATIPWAKCSPRLAAAQEFERTLAELSPSGYGIHWPLLDEDLAIGPLVKDCQ